MSAYWNISSVKQFIKITEENTPPTVITFIRLWKERKGYVPILELSIGEAIELLMAVTYSFYKDDSDGRFFNNVLRADEVSVQWEGEELIDILYYEIVQTIKKRMGIAGTFNAPLDNFSKKENT